jgi:hypothetical protein
MLFLQQGIEHMQLVVAWMPFRVTGDTDGEIAAGHVRDVLHEPAAVVVGAGGMRGVAPDGEDFHDAGGFTVTKDPRQLRPAFQAPGGEMRDHVVAEKAKLD